VAFRVAVCVAVAPVGRGIPAAFEPCWSSLVTACYRADKCL